MLTLTRLQCEALRLAGGDRWNTCGQGIHFYLTRIEAENN